MRGDLRDGPRTGRAARTRSPRRRVVAAASADGSTRLAEHAAGSRLRRAGSGLLAGGRLIRAIAALECTGVEQVRTRAPVPVEIPHDTAADRVIDFE